MICLHPKGFTSRLNRNIYYPDLFVHLETLLKHIISVPHPAFGVDLVFQQIYRQSDDWNNGTSSKMFRYHQTKLNNSKSVFPSCTPILTKGHLLVRFLTIISVFSLLLLAGLILGPVGLRAISWQKPWHV